MASRPTGTKGARFPSEASLQRTLAKLNWSTLLDHDHALGRREGAIALRRELPVCGRIPDVVMVRFMRPPSPAYLSMKCSYRHAFVIWQIRRSGPLAVGEIAQRVFTDVEMVRPAVDDLLNNGILHRLPCNRLTLADEVDGEDAEIFAIEAKLTRWREAIEQAQSYRSFADYSIVAMTDNALAQGGRVESAAREAGLGLLQVGKGSAAWVVPPIRTPAVDRPERDWILAHAANSDGGRWSRV